MKKRIQYAAVTGVLCAAVSMTVGSCGLRALSGQQMPDNYEALYEIGVGTVYGDPDVNATMPAIGEVVQQEMEVQRVDVANLPALMEPVEGYYPYILSYYYNDNDSICTDVAPGFHVLEGSSNDYYTLQTALEAGILKNVAVYTADGVLCNLDDVAVVSDDGTFTQVLTRSAYYTFYLCEGITVEVFPFNALSVAYEQSSVEGGNLGMYCLSCENAVAEHMENWNWPQQILTAEVGSSGDGTVERVTSAVSSVGGRPLNNVEVLQPYVFFVKESRETVSLGA